MSYLRDILELGVLPAFDEGVFQVHLTIGRSIVAQGGPNITGVNLLTEKLGSMLALFNASWELSTGLSMEILWEVFRPATAKTISQLEARLKVEELAERFDSLKWGAGASFRDLDLLRRSIVRMYHMIDAKDVVSDDQIKVSRLLQKIELQLMKLGYSRSDRESRKTTGRI